MEYINTTKSADVIHPDVIHFAAAAEDGNSTAEIAMQYTDSYQEQILSFANNIHNPPTAAPMRTALSAP